MVGDAFVFGIDINLVSSVAMRLVLQSEMDKVRERIMTRMGREKLHRRFAIWRNCT